MRLPIVAALVLLAGAGSAFAASAPSTCAIIAEPLAQTASVTGGLHRSLLTADPAKAFDDFEGPELEALTELKKAHDALLPALAAYVAAASNAAGVLRECAN